jgi:hypothetical protein
LWGASAENINSVAVERQKHLPLEAAFAIEVIALNNKRYFVN